MNARKTKPKPETKSTVPNLNINVPASSKARPFIPGHVFRQAHFKWQPQAFALEDAKFEGKLVSEKLQIDSLATFEQNTKFPGIFAIGGNPDDARAKYFAAYLTHLHMQANGAASHVIWEPIYGGFENRLLSKPDENVSMLVLYNLTPEATATKLEKTRDLLEHYSNIPRVIVLAGGDPVSFLCGRLHVPLNAIVYLQGQVLNTIVI